MKPSESLERRRDGGLRRSSRRLGDVGVWSVEGGVAALAAAVILVKNFPDIRRYFKIKMM